MSDIRYNGWLHRSGTGGVWQDSSGRVGIGTSVGMTSLINSGPNALTFGTGTTPVERLRIDTSGHVGVTSASPVATRFSGTVSGLLNVAGTKPCVYISETDSKDSSGTNRALYMGLASGTAYAGSNAPFSFATGDTTTTERVRIDTAGNVNITGVTTAAAFVPTTGHLSRRNLIINGGMKVAQRGTIDQLLYNYAGPDRFYFGGDGGQRSEVSQATLTVDGKGQAYAWRFDNRTANASPSAGHFQVLQYRIEGQDVQHLKKGTSDTEALTLQFWIKSPKAGTHVVELVDQDNTRHISKSYTVSSANTWQYITVTFAGDTSGAFTNDVNLSLELVFWLMAGSTYSSGTLATSWASVTNANRAVGQVNCVDNAANNFYLTGVQLEVGSYATPFEHRTYGEELQSCLRYCQRHTSGNGGRVAIGVIGDATTGYASFPNKVPMRATPTISVTEAGKIVKEGTAWYDLTSLTIGTSSNDVSVLTCVVSGGHNMSALDPFTMGDYTDFTLNAEL